MHPFGVSQHALNNLEQYKYSAVDLSPVSKYIMQPYWTWATTLFPMWIAPNLITLLGFVFIMGNVALVLVYIPDLSAGEPSWIYFSMGAGIFLYSTFDNVDGKQARRTGSSSPLGELFDHGVDALNSSFGTILQAAGLGVGLSGYYVALIFMVVTAFFFSTWETYYTGTLYLGYVNGPTEGLLLAVFSLIVSGLYGSKIWWTKIDDIMIMAHLPITNSNLRLIDTSVGTIFLLLIITQIPVSIIRVRNACRQKRRSFTMAMLHIVPFAIINIAIYIWISAPGSIALNTHGILFSCTWGISFGRIAALIVLGHVTHTNYPLYPMIVIPYVIGAVLARGPEIFGQHLHFSTILGEAAETRYIHIMFALVALDYMFWILTVINQFCKHLGIQCLRISPQVKRD
ncbi:hypothetical protein BATDEDRAFT_18655 [Batrachochytrium dendrobatidis JAM81]|uniref:Choline/ethanolaminephosphotransferase n=2 Tax=Batrachochytrium dendrobatidis TaxID=109871 RepID=F4NU64_BATDJ|nr:uncharacterized protein BATDEDRAFT_18655 [Batrachochytrium dendrobatidis JAM81]EGF84386.1 hypothetical protein BATDEDRAFT_18655 [Batrachochytrium dendrobatidis JAM81]KAJ8327269.1 hypothetical protein O5D80_004673 [Batrachochytrium dendrobatidis]KAK5667833.1 hypothetical protein QVD99_004882 [Batrachochytrium dendrobatidis]|eukprot:XP_006675198.1 hypothetical protein BATDEDRAFT_18655 [Batrachochytrium dendrobatidis JAM81]